MKRILGLVCSLMVAMGLIACDKIHLEHIDTNNDNICDVCESVIEKEVERYQVTLTFYVNPMLHRDEETGGQFGGYGAYSIHVMDNMVKLLNSETFAMEILDGMISTGSEVIQGIEKYQADSETLTSEYKVWLSALGEAVSYSSKGEGDSATNFDANIMVEANFNGGQGEQMAREISEQVQRLVPNYVEENMTVPVGYDGTSCQLLTTLTDPILVKN